MNWTEMALVVVGALIGTVAGEWLCAAWDRWRLDRRRRGR